MTAIEPFLMITGILLMSGRDHSCLCNLRFSVPNQVTRQKLFLSCSTLILAYGDPDVWLFCTHNSDLFFLPTPCTVRTLNYDNYCIYLI